MAARRELSQLVSLYSLILADIRSFRYRSSAIGFTLTTALRALEQRCVSLAPDRLIFIGRSARILFRQRTHARITARIFHRTVRTLIKYLPVIDPESIRGTIHTDATMELNIILFSLIMRANIWRFLFRYSVLFNFDLACFPF